ncbi:MAG: PD-(D/E)XK nuclease family protein [Spirochaetes bacterium]|nr:PD-(D/E)XK nuclease family protein [Spirochaetota bacterium]
MIEQNTKIILTKLGDANTVFVFPSDLAAADALTEALRHSGRAALPLQRFISWDNFKNKVFAGNQQKRPSSSLLRLFFARSLLLRNQRKPFLNSILPREQAAASLNFVRHVAKALPALGSLPAGLDGRKPSPLLAEWLLIRQEYSSFMAEKELYEAAWEVREAESDGNSYILFFPDLTDDWQDYAPALRDSAYCNCRLYSEWQDGQTGAEKTGSEMTAMLAATRFPSALAEIRAVLLQIRQVVAKGLHPADILISIADLEQLRPVLEREAAVIGIPLDIREAGPLADSCGGRLLRDLLDTALTDCSFTAMRRLLLDKARSFRQADCIRRLMQLGLDKHILASIPDLEGDIWLASMDSRDRDLADCYRKIRNTGRKLLQANSFAAVREAYDAFRKEFIDGEQWSDLQNDELARCILVLEELEDTARELGLAVVEGAAELWFQQLEDSPYLPLARSSGIPVHRFRVSAGCNPALHFVLNLNEQATRIEARKLSFLREDERVLLAGEDRDLSEGILRLLALSGRRVYLSFAVEGPAGIRPPHPLLQLQDSPAGAAEDRGSPALLPFCPEEWLPLLERSGPPQAAPAATETSQTCIPGIFPLQQRSIRAAFASSLRKPEKDLAEGKTEDPVRLADDIREILLTKKNRDEWLHLSTSLVESYTNCAFRCVYERLLHIRPIDTSLNFLDNLMIGKLYHSILQETFRPLHEQQLRVIQAAAEGETARPADNDLEIATQTALQAFSREHGPFAGLLAEAMLPLLRLRLQRSLDSIRTLMDNYIPFINDQDELYMSLPESRVRLEGRPDLVCREPTAEPNAADFMVRIIDYKKNSLPSLKELKLHDGELGKLQIPVYIMLLEQAGAAVEAAWYCSIESAIEENNKKSGKTNDIVLAFGENEKCALHPAELEEIRQAVASQCAAVADHFRAGDIFTPSHSQLETNCRNCELRPVCRRHHTVR